MPLLKDMTNYKFGKLLVKKYLGNGKWECLCDCGNVTAVNGGNLRNGLSNSCGCSRIQLFVERITKDLSGIRFGHLTAIYSIEKRVNGGGRYWACICDCGLEKIASTKSLMNGHCTSCGICSRAKDLTGKRFGKLSVISRGTHLKYKGVRNSTWNCKCDCGNEIQVIATRLVSGNVKSCGCIMNMNESWIATQLKKYLQSTYNAIPEYKCIKNPKTGYWLPYDVYIPEGIYIEVHGEQHYKLKPYFHRTRAEFEKQQRMDKYKKDFAEHVGTYIEIDLRKIKTVEDAIAYIEERLG